MDLKDRSNSTKGGKGPSLGSFLFASRLGALRLSDPEGATGMSIMEAFFFIDCRFFTRWHDGGHGIELGHSYGVEERNSLSFSTRKEAKKQRNEHNAPAASVFLLVLRALAKAAAGV